MKHAAFFEAAIPEPQTLLGLRLRPFSAGHLILLHRIESPYLYESDKAYLDDLAFAVRICSLDWQSGCAWLDDPSRPKELSLWGRALAKTQPDWPAKHVAFQEYLADGMKVPDFAFDEDKARTIEAPFVQVVKITLMSRIGLSELEYLNRPYALSLWDFMTVKAIRGELALVNNKDLDDIMSKADDILAGLKAKGLYAGA